MKHKMTDKMVSAMHVYGEGRGDCVDGELFTVYLFIIFYF